MKSRNMDGFLITCRIWILTVLLLTFASYAGANDSIVYDNGHNVYPIKTDKIRMVSEKITVVMDRTKPNVAYASAKVTCDFLFENESNFEIIAEVGFPTITMGEFFNQHVSLKNFRSFIEGKEVDVSIKKEMRNNATPLTDESEVPHRYWYTWKAKFPPKKRLRIRNTYETRLSEDSVSRRWFKYILVTGANWNGKIDRSVIEVVYPDDEQLRSRVIGASPEGFRVVGNRIMWDLRDFIPTENILVDERWTGFRSADREVIKVEIKDKIYEGDIRLYSQDDLESGHTVTSDDYIYYSFGNIFTKDVYLDDIKKVKARVLRNEIFARHGRIFKSEDLTEIFEGANWYRPDPDFSDNALNDIEKRNVQFILDYEKRMGWR